MISSYSKRHSILWADDDLDDFLLIREVLQDTDHPYDIVEVSNGRKLLDHLRAIGHPNDFPRLIILDMNMPVLNGRETLAILKSEPLFAHIPVVVFTTSSSELDKMFCRRFGVELMTKPSDIHCLREAVNKLLNYCNAL